MDSTAQSHVFCLSYAYIFPERRRRRRRLYRHMTHFGRNPTRGTVETGKVGGVGSSTWDCHLSFHSPPWSDHGTPPPPIDP